MSRAAAAAVRVHAPAKINLSLRVLARRDNGYHDIRTVFQSIAMHDTLVFERMRGPLELRCSDPECPADDTNLVWRAAQRLWTWSGRKGRVEGVSIRLTKRVPSRAGLGGGSSDAAATLRALAALWRIEIGFEELTRLAAELGADVPFFLHGGTALGVDRGDTVFPLPDLPAYDVVVVIPRFGVSTADAYRWFDEAPPASARAKRPAGEVPSLGIPPVELRNDLEVPVTARHPEVGRLVRRLRREGAAYAAMSGSGSAVFGLFARGSGADAAATLQRPDVSALVTRTLTARQALTLSRVRHGRPDGRLSPERRGH